METLVSHGDMALCLCSYRTYEEWKPDLKSVTLPVELRSYRTYEEWKPNKFKIIIVIFLGSYRTYEEWKLSSGINGISIDICSYRTYEEWKLVFSILYDESDTSVLTVPMRNGNRLKTDMFM